jgi:hypothetical protein
MFSLAVEGQQYEGTPQAELLLQHLKKLQADYGVNSLIIVFATARQWHLSWG